MIPIIKWTLWQRRWSTVWWSVGVFGLIFINMIFYPTFKDQAAELQKTFENLPKAAVQLFGGSTDFFSPVGFLNSQIFFLMLPLLLGILAIAVGSSLIAKEEQDQTMEMLLARPLSRSKLILAKAAAGAIAVTIVSIVGLLTTLITARVVDLDISIVSIAAATLSCYLMVLCFGAIAFALTTIGRARGASLGIAALIAIGGYLVSSLSGTVSWLKTPSKLFPFHYYQPEMLLRGIYNWGDLVVFVSVIIVCGVLSVFSFRKRDIG